MSAARLTFLHPHLFRPLHVAERQPLRSSKRRCGKPPGLAYISTGSPMRESTFASRHGKAVEPAVFLMGPPKSGSEGGEGKGPDTRSTKQEQAPGEQPSKSTTNVETLSPEGPPEAQQGRQTAKNEGDSLDNGPMETVLQAGAGSAKEAAKKLPQSPRPRYVHHFDSYSLVKELEKGGFTQAQSITTMKAIRTLLAKNLYQAQTTLVSKSDVENETYLFRAACSELSTEVKNNRKEANEEMRQQRTTLQHEVDILTQTLNQELVTLGDNVKSMFNERKMAAREEQNEIASSIQELSLKISAKLNSDAKSDIEGVRWVLIRSAALGIGFAIMSGLLLIQQSRRKKVEKVKDENKKKLEEEILKQGHGKVDHNSAPDAAEILAAN